MGQQQLLLVILGVIIVGIAIAAGLTIFSAQNIQSNKDAIINDLNNIAAYAYQYRIRPTTLSGGAGKYTGLVLPPKLATNENAIYTCTPSPDGVVFTAVSVSDAVNTVVASIDSEGKFLETSWKYTGDFK